MMERNEQLHDVDRRLMLRLAGELSPRETEALEEEIAARPELRRRLEELERLERSAYSLIDRLDRQTPMPQRGAVVRNAVRAMERWNNQRLANQAARQAARTQSLATRWWMYPAAAAAIVLIGMLIWWNNTVSDPNVNNVAVNPGYPLDEPRRSPERFTPGWQPMQHAFADSLTTPSLDEMDRELRSLTYIRESMH
jgi:anti-sigma factor RsiW